MFIVKYYLLVSVLFFIFAILTPDTYSTVIFSWVGISFLAVSFAYITDYPKIFRKKIDGRVPWYSKWLLFPFYISVQAYNSIARRRDKVPSLQEITPQLFLACRLFPSDVEQLKKEGVSAVLDATSEFDGLGVSSAWEEMDYYNVPILDHKVPKGDEITEALYWIQNKIKNDQKVVVHCALGRGRSVLIVAAYLIASGEHSSVESALEAINSIRATARLNGLQFRKLEKMQQRGQLTIKQEAIVIANPVAGGGKWKQHKQEIISTLSPHYMLNVIETSKGQSIAQTVSSSINKDTALVIACGGDGTVGEVANAIVGEDASLAIIPCGTTNALAHVMLGTKAKFDGVAHACDIILTGTSKAMDAMYCNDELSILTIGIGFEQQMIEHASRQEKNNWGEMAYLRGLQKAVGENKSLELTLTVDDQPPMKGDYVSVVIANAAPVTTLLAQGDGQPDPFDQKLDLTMIPATNTPIDSLLSMGGKAMDLKMSEHTDIAHSLITSIEVTANDKICYCLDGELREAEKLTIYIKPKAINVIHIDTLEQHR